MWEKISKHGVAGTLFLATILANAGPIGCKRTGQNSENTQNSRRAATAAGDTRDTSPRSATTVATDAEAPSPSSTLPQPPPEPPNLAEDQPCLEPDEIALFVSPRRPLASERIRVMIVSDRDIPDATLWARNPAGDVRQMEFRRFHGPPHAWSASLENPEFGTWRVALSTGAQIHTCEDITARTVRPSRRVREHVWPVRYRWDRRFENLYSAWIMQLFEYDPNERPSWSPLHEVLRDPERNWLYNRLGMNEDGPNENEAIRATPDCADTPYYLRAYFAWKMRLLFVFSACTRGRRGERPQCYEQLSNLEPPLHGHRLEGTIGPDAGVEETTPDIEEIVAFNEFMNRVVVPTVQSGAGRILPGSNQSDLYPIALSRDSIRPGTVFVDPYGHLLVVSQWVDQTDDAAGMLFAVDGHPDLSIGRKRFWRGAFLFVDDLSFGAGGFKAFRPVFLRGPEETIHRLSNNEIRRHPDYGNYSDEIYELGTDGFYERMDRIINPRPLDPVTAQMAILNAFYELMQERVDSIRAGENYMAQYDYRPIEMPEGADIFETSGAWEDYSTPARDLRLLIAIDLVTRFPDRVMTSPDAFSFSRGQQPRQVAEALRATAAEYLRSHSITYRRSNNTEQRLTLATIIQRQQALEMGYNPNDCIEIRWGAPEGSAERNSCSRTAPQEQRDRMLRYREWFHTRTRPQRR